MPRVARIVIAGRPHHVTQRGNNRQDVLFVDDDRRVYLELLRDHAQRFGVAVPGYCLMTNHVHIVGTPVHDDAPAKAIGRTNFRYAQYVNRLHGKPVTDPFATIAVKPGDILQRGKRKFVRLAVGA